jgi:hypothetical protein
VNQERFSVHNHPVWRDRADFIVNAALPEAERFEQLWCRQMSDDLFVVCCIPFFLYDVALGDTFQTAPQASRKYVLRRVTQPSGRYVFRVHFAPSMMANRDSVAVELTKGGALMEWSSQSLLAVDARDLAHAQQIADYLHEQEERQRLIYETGKTAH